MPHEVREPVSVRLKQLVPFGLASSKPRHFRDMAKIGWKNRDNLPYAWRVLSKGVCDGCALGVAGFHDWTIDGVHLCMTRLNLLRLNTMPALDHDLLADVSALKTKTNAQLREMGRLAYPMLRRQGEAGFSRISWKQAYDTIARRIRSTTPDRLAFFQTSRGITNEVYYVAQKAARFLGTNNIDNAARLCHSPSTAAMKGAVGVAATTCSYTDWFDADLIVFFGANPANDQPVTTKYLHQAKKRGARVAMVNPYQEPGMTRYWVPSTFSSALFGTKIADHWFPVSKGGDIAFLYGVLKIIFENGWQDRAFVEQHAEGFDELTAACEQLDWPTLERQAGLPRASMQAFAELIHRAKKAVLVWSMGITQHVHGSDGVRMICNLGLSKGFVGRKGCGLMPIRGHSGVQGGAEMGAYATALPGGKPINAPNAAALSQAYGFDVPDEPGMPSAQMVEAAWRGELDMLYCSGGNFLRTLPDPDYVAEAMARVPLRVHTDVILTDQFFIAPAPGKDPGRAPASGSDAPGNDGGEVLLLPAKTRYEQEGGGTQTSTERRVMFSPHLERQVGEAESEWRIYLNIARAVAPQRAAVLGCDSGDAIREEIARIVPFYDGIQHLKQSGDAFQYGGAHLCADWQFPTPDGKAHFAPAPLPTHDRKPGRFDVATRRGKQFNSMVYAEVDPINDAPRDAVLICAEDAAGLHLKQKDSVVLTNEHGRFAGRVFLAPIAPGNLQIHWPEGNVLIGRGRYDAGGGVPDYNAQVSIEVVRTVT